MNRALQILEFLKFSEKLKTQLRDNKLSSGRMESVADHSWHLALMVMLVHPYLENPVNLLKTLKMAAVHDLTEAEIGDIPFVKSYTNSDIKKLKKDKETQEIARIKGMVGGSIGEDIYNLWHEFEQRSSGEAKLLKALDSLEGNFQAILFGDIDWWDDGYYDLVLAKAGGHCLHETILTELNEEINKQTEIKMRRIGLDVEAIKHKNGLCKQ